MSATISAGQPDNIGVSLGEAVEIISSALLTGTTPDPERLEKIATSLAVVGADSEVRAKGILDAGRFFYIYGRPDIGVRIANLAKSFSVETAQVAPTITAATLVGVCSADTGNLPRAMEAYAEALNLAKKVSDIGQEAKIWLNTGAALIYSGLFREAQACFQKVLDLGDTAEAARAVAPQAYVNFALCSLNLDDPVSGLTALKRGLELLPEPDSAHSIQHRILLENYYVRLLIEISDYDGALSHARTARGYANQSKSPRADIQASVAEGLAEAFSGNLDVGISRLTATLERAKALKLASREVLVALVKALEYAGRHDEALKYLQEMLSAQRKTAEANVLHHVHQHLVQLHSADSNSSVEDIKQVMRRMETRVEVVEGRVAKVEVIKQRQELFKARIEAMERLAVAAELRDDSTGEHSYRVGRMACLLAKEAGCDDETIFMIDIAARLHDVGKIGIPDGILLKPSGFNPAERTVMEMHAEIGADVLAKSEIPHIKMAEEIARHHHERWNGKGYPAKIGGREIPLAARITSLADVYDALTHKRPYKAAWTVEATLNEIFASRGTHFDPELTDLFLALVSRLRREHRDLDHYLGEAARASPFIQARGKIWDTLKLAREEYQLEFQRSMDLQR
jgi:putative two-component system response regulator